LPPTSVKPRSAGSRRRKSIARLDVQRQSSSVIGCQVLCQVKSPTGIDEAGVPMFAPKVNR
jgi:hypothetical protein